MTLILNNRVKNAIKLQDVLTESGCIIKTRLGLHEAGDACSNEGLIILQLAGSEEEIQALEKKLNSVDGVKAKNVQICSEW
jgi:metal-responsive CopG/Arc/MetJ family transcriptional regulator